MFGLNSCDNLRICSDGRPRLQLPVTEIFFDSNNVMTNKQGDDF